jgi:hypothetical protein
MIDKRSPIERVGTVNQHLDKVNLVTYPFPHFTLDSVFDDDLAEHLLIWLEHDAPWKCQSRDFYLQHGCSGLDELLKGTPAHAAVSPEMIETIRKQCERIFGAPLLAGHVQVSAHRMVAGHRIGVHNDQPTGGTDTHRLVVNLNRGVDDLSGGELVLFDRDDPAGSAVFVSRKHNSGAAMMFSARSWHCVEEIRAGVRYSLLYSFWSPVETAERGVAQTKTKSSMDGSTLQSGLAAEDADELRRALRDRLPALVAVKGGEPPRTSERTVRWGCDRDTCKSALFHDVTGGWIAFSSLSPDAYGSVRDILGERAVVLTQMMDGLDGQALLHLRRTGAVFERDCRVAVGDLDQRAIAALFWARVLDHRDASVADDGGFDAFEIYHATAECLTRRAVEDIRRYFPALDGQRAAQ